MLNGVKLSCQFNSNIENLSESGPEIYISKVYIGKFNIDSKYNPGIFANKDFTSDEIIEKAPFIESQLDKSNDISRDYSLNTKNGKVALGYISLYNHSDNPNAILYFDNNIVIIKTKKPIKKDQEIFISYDNDYWKTINNKNY